MNFHLNEIEIKILESKNQKRNAFKKEFEKINFFRNLSVCVSLSSKIKMDEDEEVDIVGGLDNFMSKNEREM